MATHIQNFASFTERVKANKVVQEQSKKSDTQEQYSAFFKKMLQKYDISSPAELKSDEEKKKFFDEVSAGWDQESSKPTSKGKEILNEKTGEINESAFALAGGIILAVIGLNAVRSLVNRVLVGIGKNVDIEPEKLKTLVRDMSTEALSVGLNTKDSSIINNWQRKVESLIDAGEIKTLGQVEKYMDTDLKTEIFESVVNEAAKFKNTKNFEDFLEEIDGMGESQIKKIMGKDYIDTPGNYNEESEDYDNDIVEYMISNMGKKEFERLQDWWEANVAESVVNEEEINNDDEFRAYAETVLKKMHGSEYDANKAKEVINGLLSKKDGNDYGAIVGMLNKG
jgi:hypothetical protein